MRQWQCHSLVSIHEDKANKEEKGLKRIILESLFMETLGNLI